MNWELRMDKIRNDVRRATARGDKSEVKRLRKELQRLWVRVIES